MDNNKVQDITMLDAIKRMAEVREEYIKLKDAILQNKDNNNDEIPFQKRFIASIQDFNIINSLEQLTDEELLSKYGIKSIEHLYTTIKGHENVNDTEDKFKFSLITNIQICSLLNGKIKNYEELLQTLYMTIFQRYNDDIKKDENYNVSSDFADKVYRFAGEGKHPEVKDIKTSEKDIGCVYMTYEEYKRILAVWNKEYETEEDRRIATKIEMVKYILSNIRNRMMHGDFNNKIDREGNKIVEILPYGFKAKFFFDCIEEFYEAVAKEIENRTEKEDVLFDFEKVLLRKENADTTIIKNKDKVMTLILPLYVNSFLTYNFKQKNAYDKLRKSFIQEEQSQLKVDFLDKYYKKGKTDSFVYKVAEYNKENLGVEYNAYEIFEHFRNSVVHNNFKCKDGMIYLKDYNEEGTETARFIIPYEMIEELIETQSKYASRYLGVDFPGSPGENHEEASNEGLEPMEI